MVTRAPAARIEERPTGVLGPDGEGLLPWLRPVVEAVLSQRRGHAVLLDALAGVGEFELGIALAQSGLCEDASPGTGLACGRCAACRLVTARTHPDLRVVVPEALQETLGWGSGAEDAGEGGSEGAASRRKPSREIRVEQVRAVVSFATVTAARGRGKVVVVYPAERMNAIAANTLLKTLEEPAGDTRFVLASGAAAQLLPTIRSRCQPFVLGLPETATAIAWLREQGVVQPEVLLAAAGGQPLMAKTMADDGISAEDWLSWPADWRQGRADRLVAWGLPRAVDALLRLCADLQRTAVGGAPRFFPADRLPRGADLGRLNAWARELLQAARHAEHPLHAPLAVESLAERGRRAWPAPVH
jgi:DNA polymerase-3 subunit delta'